jgi:hypothetical protein
MPGQDIRMVIEARGLYVQQEITTMEMTAYCGERLEGYECSYVQGTGRPVWSAKSLPGVLQW